MKTIIAVLISLAFLVGIYANQYAVHIPTIIHL